MSFTNDLWAHTSDLRASIDALPFLTELRDGTLDEDRFRYYLTQDSLYLARYGRTLAAAASQATDAEELLFWTVAARSTVLVERELHESWVGDVDAAEPSPTCTAYTSYLAGLVSAGCYPALVAGVLPCFWIYDDVGRRLRADIGDLDGHPYASWIATYDDPEFAASTEQARQICDRVAERASSTDQARMAEAFVRACQYEWMFWDAAHRRETWPVT